MIRAVEMTEKSWILYSRTQKCGLMRRIGDKGYGIIGGPFPGEYNDLDELEKKAGDKFKFVKVKTRETVESYIDEMPVKHIDIFDVDTENEFPTYAKKKGSTDRYAAGYWCLQFKGKWQGSFCPRLKTVNENPHLGPFKTKIEMDHTIRVENSKNE